MKVHVLVVDDEPDMQTLFEQNFKEEIQTDKLLFYFARSGEKAIEQLKIYLDKTHLVLILSDINMAGMSGWDLLKLIKTIDINIPICMITAYGNEETAKRAKECGAREVINKPIDFGYLKNLIWEIMRLYKSKDTDSAND